MREWPNQPILLVEDSPEDFETTERAFRRSGLKNPIYRCADGEEALDFLYRRGPYSRPGHAPRPGGILLHPHLPGTGGPRGGSQIHKEPQMKQIPGNLLTT